MFIDTHCHLNLMAKDSYEEKFCEKDFKKIEEIIIRSKNNKVEKFLTVGTDLAESKNSILISKQFDSVYSVIGLHPCDANDLWQNDLQEIKQLILDKKENKIVGIGETGLDYFHKPFDKDLQIKVFETHIELAIENNLPLVIHVRDSVQDLYDILKNYKNKITGVVHCFSQDKNYAQQFLDLDLYLGIGAIITYPKNDYLREIVNFMPLDRILLETDAPFLPPQEFRGKRNSPEYIPIIANAIADIKKVNLEVIENITTNNAKKLFGI